MSETMIDPDDPPYQTPSHYEADHGAKQKNWPIHASRPVSDAGHEAVGMERGEEKPAGAGDETGEAVQPQR